MTTANELETPPAPSLVHLFTMKATLGDRFDGGDGPLGRRVFNTATGGEFAGARLKGEILPGSADWMLIRKDGAMVIDARTILRCDDGAVIHITYGGRILIPADLLAQARDPAQRGLIDPTQIYIRTAVAFETGSEAHAWLNNLIGVGVGRLTEQGLEYDVFQVD